MAQTPRAWSHGIARRAVATLGSPLAIATLGLPILTALAHSAVVKRDLGPLLAAGLFRSWGAALAAAILLGLLDASWSRRWARLAVLGGLLALALQPELSRLVRFEGGASVGEGEEAPRWRWTKAGAIAATPELGQVELEPEGSVLLLGAGAPVRLAVGASGHVPGATITLREVGWAPAFRIRAPDGTVVEEGLVELSQREPGFIELASLPHRFYFSEAGKGAGADGAPDRLRVRVQRGKRKVLDAELARGEERVFDGLRISWDDGASWALLEVAGRSIPYLALAGLALVAEGALAAWLARRRSR